MDILTNCFERRWFYVFMGMYLLIMLPLPCFFSTVYRPGWLGVPLFVYGWLIHGITVFLLILLFAHQCLKRPEYQDQTLEDRS